MDRRSIIILAVCFVLFMAWSQMVQRLYPPPRTASRTNLISNASKDSSMPGPEVRAPGLEAAAGTPPARTNGPESLLVLTGDNARYTFTSRGGGLKLVELLKYPETVSCDRLATSSSNRLAALNAQALQPVLALVTDGRWGEGDFELSRYTRTIPADVSNAVSRTVQGVRAERTLEEGLRLVKEFELGTNYLMDVRARFENRAAHAVSLPAEQWVAGTATPLHVQDDGNLVGLHWYDGRTDTPVGRAYFDNKTLGCFRGTERTFYNASDRPVTWAAANNQFFFLALIPKVPASGVSAVRFVLPPPAGEEVAADSRALTNQYAYQVNVQYPSTNLAAGQTMEREFTLFAGPKEYRTLERIGATMHNHLDSVMGYGGFWGFFSGILLLSMNGLNSMGLSYGLAIIAITVIIKMLFWPLTAISTRASKRMQLLQPQMKALQEKFKDDPVKMNKKLMEFMKEHKVSPMSGCWPVLLQTPVLIGFFKMVQSAIELRGASFLWACDLSKSDTVWQIPGLHLNVNPLSLMMGATMLWQARLMPPSPGMDPMQQKMMKYFPMIFLVVLYNYSAGLTLYWTVQNLLSIAQMKLTRAVDDRRKAAATQPSRPGPVQPQKKKR